MMTDFYIPVSRADLLKSSVPNAYLVREVTQSRHLQNNISKCQHLLNREGPLYILKSFDTLFSVLHDWSSLPTSIKEDAWGVILRGCEISNRQLANLLEHDSSGGTNLSRQDLNSNRNALKMHVYLLCQFVELFENELTACSTGSVAATGKSGRGRGRAGTSKTSRVTEASSTLKLTIDWIAECTQALAILNQLCRLQLNKLWNPPVAEEDFINLLANCCYKLLEDRQMASNVGLRSSASSLLAVLVRRYGHSIACSVKLCQMLHCFPHMVSCLVAIVRSFLDEEQLASVVRELLKEICSYNGSDLERDSQATSNLCGFLVEVANNFPQLAQSILPWLRPRLDEDPYQMRNCVLSIIGEILLLFAKREQLDPKERVQRDRLMDLLQDHIHDVNGYVRAKALQIWHNIVATRGLPVRRQSELAKLLVGPMGAMMDQSSLARKYACKIITAMVMQSPAAKLTPDELNSVVDKEKKRLEHFEELLAKVNPYGEEVEESDNVGQQQPSDEAHDQQSTSQAKSRQTRSALGRNTEVENCNASGESSTLSTSEARDDEANSTADSKENTLVNEEAAAGDDSCYTPAYFEAAIHNAAAAVSAPTQVELCSNSVAHTELASRTLRQRACVAFLCETLAFAGLLQSAITDFQAMLASKTLSDVTEAVDFFVAARGAGVKTIIDRGVKQIFIQIWSQEESIRKVVLEAFRKLYLQPHPEEPLPSNLADNHEIVNLILTNLSEFIRSAELGTLVSVERILTDLVASNQLNVKLIDHVWQRFTASIQRLDKASQDDAKSMLLIAKLLVKPGEKELLRHLTSLIQLVFAPSCGGGGETTCPDLEKIKFTCEVILRLAPRPSNEKTSGTCVFKSSRPPFRLQPTDQLFTCLQTILIDSVTQLDQDLWIPAMEQAITVIYTLSENPELLTASIIQSIAEKLYQSRKLVVESSFPPTISPVEEESPDNILGQAEQEVQQQSLDDSQAKVEPSLPSLDQAPSSTATLNSDPSASSRPQSSVTCPSFLMARFLSLVGHVCLKQLVHMEYDLLKELKRRAAESEQRSSSSSSKKSRKSTAGDSSRSCTQQQPQSLIHQLSVANTSRSASNLSISTNQNAQDEESGLVGAVAYDHEADFVRQLVETELVTSPNSLFHPLLDLVTAICSDPPRFNDPDVQAAASLAMAKMMLVTQEVCEPRLQLIFTLAERSSSTIVRANLIVALGDLCRRFPNLLEPWTPHLYARLRDPSADVRTNALNTLSHLILNDMVKVKGQISEMTVCLVDDNDRLNVLARQFFVELSKKGNSLYNVIPDIISRLSDTELALSEEHFRAIMDDQRQWRDLSHCLRVIQFNERMMRVLYENIATFADKLNVPEVYAVFEQLVINAKKFVKPESMSTLEEFEAKINEFHSKGVADEAAIRRAELAAKKLPHGRRKSRSSSILESSQGDVRRRNLRRGGANQSTSGQQRRDIEQLVEEEEEDESGGTSSGRRRSTRVGKTPQQPRRGAKRGGANPRLAFSSSEDEESSEESDSSN